MRVQTRWAAAKRAVGIARGDARLVEQVVAELRVDEGRAGGERRGRREQGRQRLVLDLDERGGVLGGGAALGGERHDRLADVAHALQREREHGAGLHALVVEEHAAVGLAEPRGIFPGEHAGDAGRAPGGVERDARQARVSVRAAHERDVDHARQREIVHVAAAAGEQARIVAAFDARSDVRHG